jgi:hypothetical protein
VASALVIILRLVGMTVAISSLLTFALVRINYLFDIAKATFPLDLTPDKLEYQSALAYQNAGIEVIAEMLLLGAVVCLLALIPAFLMQGGVVEKSEPPVSDALKQETNPTPGR